MRVASIDGAIGNEASGRAESRVAIPLSAFPVSNTAESAGVKHDDDGILDPLRKASSRLLPPRPFPFGRRASANVCRSPSLPLLFLVKIFGKVSGA